MFFLNAVATPQLLNLAGLVTIRLLHFPYSAISYPFQPREPLLLFSLVSILIAAAVTLFTFARLNRDNVLARLYNRGWEIVRYHDFGPMSLPDVL
jgi:hypothetical protein